MTNEFLELERKRMEERIYLTSLEFLKKKKKKKIVGAVTAV
jgi:hypothetical protein